MRLWLNGSRPPWPVWPRPGSSGGALLAAYGGKRIRIDATRGESNPLARSLFSSWALPFELLSLLLLAALVAAFALSRTDDPANAEPRP